MQETILFLHIFPCCNYSPTNDFTNILIYQYILHNLSFKMKYLSLYMNDRNQSFKLMHTTTNLGSKKLSYEQKLKSQHSKRYLVVQWGLMYVFICHNFILYHFSQFCQRSLTERSDFCFASSKLLKRSLTEVYRKCTIKNYSTITGCLLILGVRSI